MGDGLVDKIGLTKSQDSISSCTTDFPSGAWLSCSVSSGLTLISQVCNMDNSTPLIHRGILWINTLNVDVVFRCYGEKKKKVIQTIRQS